jgi:glycosyltransferase involved in cell wall biosynthesis
VRRRPPEEWAGMRGLRVHALATSSQVTATQLRLPLAVRAAGVDVLYCAGKPPPAACTTPVLDGIYDTVPWTRPETMGRCAAHWYRILDGLAVRRRAHVATLTEAAADDLEHVLGLDRGRIHVVGTALAPWLAGVMDGRPETAPNPHPYVLSLCRMEPRKGLSTLLDAWPQVRDRYPALRLVLAGKVGWGVDEVVERARRMPGVEMAGWVDNIDLPDLYRGASCFVTASKQEGFGLPVLEAMAMGAPVVASGIAPHREVGGAGVVTFPPGDAAALADEVIRVLGDQQLATRLRRLGRERAAAFTSERVAERLHRALVTTAERRAA